MAFNYGGRAEIVDAVRDLVADGVRPDKVTEKAIRSRLYFPDQPDPDLVIRTSGEHRISNFLLWQLAYSELVFDDVLWPDFRRANLFAKRCVAEVPAAVSDAYGQGAERDDQRSSRDRAGRSPWRRGRARSVLAVAGVTGATAILVTGAVVLMAMIAGFLGVHAPAGRARRRSTERPTRSPSPCGSPTVAVAGSSGAAVRVPARAAPTGPLPAVPRSEHPGDAWT